MNVAFIIPYCRERPCCGRLGYEITSHISCTLHISAESGALKEEMGMDEGDSLRPEDEQFLTCLNTSYRAPRDTAFSVRRSHLHMKLSPVIMVSSGPE